MLPGGGLCVQKVPLGVTVRQIKFIDDASVSTISHPLYALLISKETECDQSHLNDDGLTTEERRGAKDEKEREKTRRQVEADLGGFEVEQEWVEEIEREDCFEVEKKYGGAPPIPGRVYEIWVRWHLWELRDMRTDLVLVHSSCCWCYCCGSCSYYISFCLTFHSLARRRFRMECN